jgi:hypothetical protein
VWASQFIGDRLQNLIALSVLHHLQGQEFRFPRPIAFSCNLYLLAWFSLTAVRVKIYHKIFARFVALGFPCWLRQIGQPSLLNLLAFMRRRFCHRTAKFQPPSSSLPFSVTRISCFVYAALAWTSLVSSS